mgnify:CR=1 FL=1
MKFAKPLMFTVFLALFALTASAQEVYKYKLGNYEVISLNEGSMSHNESNIKLADTVKLDKYKKIDGWNEGALNYFVVDTGKQKILFDAGLPGGNTVKMLAKAGLKPEDIDIVMITHMHGDHIGGMLDEKGKAVFPKAKIYIAQEEAAYWGDTTKTGGGFTTARNVLDAYKANTTLFSQKAKLEGIESIPTFGHTPGHTSFRVTSAGKSLYIWGDIVHAKIQFTDPDVYLIYDVDPAQAVKTRKQLMQQLADSGEFFAGMHVVAPAVGMLKKASTGFEFVPGM